MVSKRKNSAPKTFFLIVTSLVIIIVGFPLIMSLSQTPQQKPQVLQAASASVSIIDFQFSPATVTVAAGTTVTWTNMSASGSDHTTTSDSQTGAEHWDSGLTNPTGAGGLPETFSHTFTTPGTYTYHCNVHTFMRGTVVVTAAGTAPTATTAPAPTATTVPATIAPTAITPTLVCEGGNGTPPCATIPPTQTTVSGNPTPIPTLNITQPTPGSGGGSGNPTAISLLIEFILLILKFLQSLI